MQRSRTAVRGSLSLFLAGVVLGSAPAAAPLQPFREEPLPVGARARLGTARFRVTGDIRAVALSPDGKRLAVVRGARLSLLDSMSGRMLRTLATVNEDLGDELVFVDHGQLLALADHRGILVWDVVTGKRAANKLENKPMDSRLAFSAGGRAFAVTERTERDGTYSVLVRDLLTGKRLTCIRSSLVRMFWIALSPDGKLLATSGEEEEGAKKGENTSLRQVVRLWDVTTGKAKQDLPTGVWTVRDGGFSPDGRLLVTVTEQSQVQLWEVKTGNKRWEGKKRWETGLAKSSVSKVCFNADGEQLAVIDLTGMVEVWETRKGKRIGNHGPEVNMPTGVGFRSDGRPMAWGCRQQVLHFWNPVSGADFVPPGGHRVPVHALVFGRGGRILYALDQKARLLHWDLATGKELRSFGLGRRLYGNQIWGKAAFAPDGRELVMPDYSDNLLVIDPQTGRKRYTLGAEHVWSAGWQVAFAADGSRLGGFVNVHHNYPDRELPVLIRDRARDRAISGVTADFRKAVGKRMDGVQIPRSVSGAFSSDGRRVAVAVTVGEERGRSRIDLIGWDLDSGKKLGTCRLPGTVWPRLAVAADGQSVVVTGAAGKLFVCDLVHGRVKGTIYRRWGDVLAGPLFSPDGRSFAIATDDHKGNAAARVLEWASWGERHVFRAGPAQALAYAPDGRTLLSGQDDTTILLWDLARRVGTGTPPARLWEQLNQEDAAVAGRAVQELAARPAVAVALLRERLKVPAAPTRAVVQQLIARLGADTFEERQAASAQLGRYREAVERALRAALAAKPDLEVRRRLERLLADLDRPTKEEVVQMRCVEVLQRAGTPGARDLLKDLAGGPEGLLHREAAQALRWLERKVTDKR